MRLTRADRAWLRRMIRHELRRELSGAVLAIGRALQDQTTGLERLTLSQADLAEGQTAMHLALQRHVFNEQGGEG